MQNRYQFSFPVADDFINDTLAPLTLAAWTYDNGWYSAVIDLSLLSPYEQHNFITALQFLDINQQNYRFEHGLLSLYLTHNHTHLFSLMPSEQLAPTDPHAAMKFITELTWQFDATHNIFCLSVDKNESIDWLNTVFYYAGQVNDASGNIITYQDDEVFQKMHFFTTVENLNNMFAIINTPIAASDLASTPAENSDNQPEIPMIAKQTMSSISADEVRTTEASGGNTTDNNADIISEAATPLNLLLQDLRWYQNDDTLIGLVIDNDKNRKHELQTYLVEKLGAPSETTWTLIEGDNYLRVNVNANLKSLLLADTVSASLPTLDKLPFFKPTSNLARSKNVLTHVKRLAAGDFYTDGSSYKIVLKQQFGNYSANSHVATVNFLKDYFLRQGLGEFNKSSNKNNIHVYHFTPMQFFHLYNDCAFIQSEKIMAPQVMIKQAATKEIKPLSHTALQQVTPNMTHYTMTHLSLIEHALIYEHDETIYIHCHDKIFGMEHKNNILKALRTLEHGIPGDKQIPPQPSASKHQEAIIILPKDIFEHFFDYNFTLVLPEHLKTRNSLKRKADALPANEPQAKKPKTFFTDQSVDMKSLSEFFSKYNWQLDSNKRFLMTTVVDDAQKINNFINGLNSLYAQPGLQAQQITITTGAVLKIPLAWQTYLNSVPKPAQPGYF